MYCPNCGVQNSDSAKFCKSCGNQIIGTNENMLENNNFSIVNGSQKSPLDFYLAGWKKYAVFSGRSQRAEFWWFYLPNAIIPIAMQILGAFAGDNSLMMMVYLVCIIFSLITLIPSLAVSVRRLHDIGMSGAMVWITLIPFIGIIWILILMAKDSDPGNNQYGPNPKLG